MDSRIKIFNQKVKRIVEQLEQGEHVPTSKHGVVQELESILDAVVHLLVELEIYAKEAGLYPKMKGYIEALWNRYEKVEQRSTKDVVPWIQTCLKLPICVAEGVSSRYTPHTKLEMTEFTVIDGDEAILFQDALNQNASAMHQVWEKLLKALEGKYVLSFDLLLTQMQLAAVARQYDLDVPPLIGSSLVTIFDLYFEVSASHVVKHRDDSFGDDMSSFPKPTYQETTLDRTRQTLRMLKAIVQESHETDEA